MLPQNALLSSCLPPQPQQKLVPQGHVMWLHPHIFSQATLQFGHGLTVTSASKDLYAPINSSKQCSYSTSVHAAGARASLLQLQQYDWEQEHWIVDTVRSILLATFLQVGRWHLCSRGSMLTLISTFMFCMFNF